MIHEITLHAGPLDFCFDHNPIIYFYSAVKKFEDQPIHPQKPCLALILGFIYLDFSHNVIEVALRFHHSATFLNAIFLFSSLLFLLAVFCRIPFKGQLLL